MTRRQIPLLDVPRFSFADDEALAVKFIPAWLFPSKSRSPWTRRLFQSTRRGSNAGYSDGLGCLELTRQLLRSSIMLWTSEKPRECRENNSSTRHFDSSFRDNGIRAARETLVQLQQNSIYLYGLYTLNLKKLNCLDTRRLTFREYYLIYE